LGLADHGDGLEVEGVEGLAGWQPGFGEMAFEAAAAALGNLMFGQCCQEASRRPAFLVGLSGERGPDLLDGGQPQLGDVGRRKREGDRVGAQSRAGCAGRGWGVPRM
jgi:hypothetical protein